MKQIAKTLNERPLAVFSVSAFIFTVLRLYFPMEPLLLLLFLIALPIIFLNSVTKINNFIMVFVITSMFAGIFAANYAIEKKELLVKEFDGETVRITGEITSIPKESVYGKTFFLETKTLHYKHGKYNKPCKVFVICDENTNLSFGDVITFNGKLFDSYRTGEHFGNYYMSKGAALSVRNVKILGINQNSKGFISTIRNFIISLGDKFFHGDAKQLFKALLAGDKSSFSEELTSNLSKSGLSHVACVSGMHLSILGMALYNLLKNKNRISATIVAFLVAVIFTLVTGASPSTLRALIMFSSFILAKLVVRENDSFTALAFSAMILALVNPYVIYDVGFILSFLSVLGIQIFSGFFKRILKFLPAFLAESVSATVSAQLMTIPVTSNIFGFLSVYSVFANIIVSAVFLVTLYLCFCFPLISYIPFLNKLFAAVCTLFLEIIAAVAGLFANLPYAAIGIDMFNGLEMASYYILILTFAFRKNFSEYKITFIMLFCSLLLIISGCFL